MKTTKNLTNQMLIAFDDDLHFLLEKAYIEYRMDMVADNKKPGTKQEMIRETLMKVFSK